MPEAAYCFDSWIGEFSRLANAYNGSAEFNGRKPWSINRYGIIAGGTAAGPSSVFAPDDFPQYGNSRNCWMWGHSGLYEAPPFSYAGIPPLKPYVLSCLAPKN